MSKREPKWYREKKEMDAEPGSGIANAETPTEPTSTTAPPPDDIGDADR